MSFSLGDTTHACTHARYGNYHRPTEQLQECELKSLLGILARGWVKGYLQEQGGLKSSYIIKKPILT